MSEAELLSQVLAARQMLDVTITQMIGLTFALIVAVYFFVHRSGWQMKTAVFLLYALGWFVMVQSAAHTGQYLVGLYSELGALASSGEAGSTTYIVLESVSGVWARVYLLTLNGANFVLLVGGAVFLFFWKPKAD
ncbi:hypothetical protein AB6B38_00395 [Glycocaulis abyssi]|uniref:Uncharacterized protein n=1 Tax=Glycocaulis abyssi TaxID=1433403 RepID=A0ABV9N8A5_9PROT